MPGRFRFSILSLLFVTALIASLLAAHAAQPSIPSLSVRALLVVFTSSLAIVGCFHTEGVARVFWVGVAVPLAISALSVGNTSYHLLFMVQHYRGDIDPNLGMVAATLTGAVPLLCVAPLNGLSCALAYWLLLSPKRSDRLSGTAIVALAMLPVLLGATFFVGMWFGERREGDRRDRQEQEEAVMNGEADSLGE